MKQKNYTWRHLYNSSSAKIAKFKHMQPNGTPQGWVGAATWGSPVVALAPPVGGRYE